MKMTGRIGLGLVIIAAASWSGWTLWASTRRWCPANIPVSLTKGSHTQNDFVVNVTGPYEIAVEADRNSSIPFNALTCALGTGAVWPEKECSIPSVLRVSWALTSGDDVVAQGSSDETKGGGTTSDSALRTIGHFRGQRGHHYKLSVETLSDATSLAAASPRVKVNVGGTIYEFSLVVSGFLRWGCAGIAGIGLVLLLGSVIFGRKSGARGVIVPE
jgi:hypothetical protein